MAFLQLFSAERRTIGIAEMAELVGLTRSTSHRYASTLVQLGYLQQDAKRRYVLASGAADPGVEIVRQIRYAIPADAALEELRDELGYTVSMGALAGGSVTYIHRLFGHRRGQYEIDRELRTGAHIPTYCTALGKVLLASLSDADRREHVASIDFRSVASSAISSPEKLLIELEAVDLSHPLVSGEEFTAGARSIAMFVPRPRGEPHIAIDVTMPASKLTARQLLKRTGPPIKRAVKLLSDARRR
ncbi:MAG: IclR family transcriptional regulator [Solirubrobacteraceae bacterium]